MGTGKKQDLVFQPITEGLGFHPFSDGLPYAPLTKKPERVPAVPMGTGAVAAGPATFVPPRISQQPNAPVSKMAQPQIQPRFGLLYLLKRSLAFLFDCALNIALCAAAFSVALWRQQIEPEALLAPGVALLSALFLASFNWALITAQEVAFGTTAGKRLFGLSLRGSAAAVFLRAFFFVPSVGLFAFGLIWSLFDRRRRCWHDVAVELQPLEIARL